MSIASNRASQGVDLATLMGEVSRQSNTRRDYATPVRRLSMEAEGNVATRLRVEGIEAFAINPVGHQQIGEYAGIPRDYYNRLASDSPVMLAANVNHWLAKQPTAKRFVRTLDGNVRAFLSDRYNPIDNLELLENLLPVLMSRPDLRYLSAQVTEKRLYLKVVADSLVGDVKPGDTVRMGLLITNSEVGMGSFTIAPFSDRLVCSNGAVHTQLGKRRAHLGRTLGGDDGDLVQQYLSDEAKRARDKALFLESRDVLNGVLSGNTLNLLLEDMRAAADEKIEGKVDEVVETVGRNFSLNEGERDAVLRNLIEGADLSRWGLANAITAAAHDSESYDRSTELQTLGGRLMSEPLPAVQRVAARRRRSTQPALATA